MNSSWAPERVVRDGLPGAGLRVGISGASHWHLPRHAANLRQAGAAFAGVCDADPAIAGRWARELDCPAFPDAGALLDGAKPDAVLALGRVSDMSAQAVTLLDAGTPILAEKPLGLDAAQVEPVLRAVERNAGWAAVALVQRYDPLWAHLDRLRASGALGTLVHFHLRIVNGPPDRYRSWGAAWMLDPALSGGGALRNLGIHGVDYFAHLCGPGASLVGAATTSAGYGLEVEEFGAVALRSSGGAVGTVEAGYTYPDATAGMTRSGDNEVRIGASGVYLVARDADAYQVTAERGEERLAGLRAGDRYREWIFDSLARLRAGRPPLVGVAECLEAVRLLDEAYRRARP